MASEQETILQIMKERNKAHVELETLDAKLQDEVNAIRQGALDAGRKLTASEVKRWRTIVDQQQQIADAQIELDFITLQRLDNSASIKAIGKRIGSINENLGEELKKLQKIEKMAETVKKIVAALESIAKKLAVL